eukprot:763360-Hanusia_phi.AAC.10
MHFLDCQDYFLETDEKVEIQHLMSNQVVVDLILIFSLLSHASSPPCTSPASPRATRDFAHRHVMVSQVHRVITSWSTPTPPCQASSSPSLHPYPLFSSKTPLISPLVPSVSLLTPGQPKALISSNCEALYPGYYYRTPLPPIGIPSRFTVPPRQNCSARDRTSLQCDYYY